MSGKAFSSNSDGIFGVTDSDVISGEIKGYKYIATITYTPADKNFAAISYSYSYEYDAVAYYKSTTNIYYETIEEALLHTTSGQIYVIPGTNPTILNNCIIENGII